MTTLRDLSKGLGNPFKNTEKGTSYNLTQTLNQGTYTFVLNEEIGVTQVGLWLGDEYVGFFCDGTITFHLVSDINSNDLIIKSLPEDGEVKRVKLEKVAIANKWTPAPEDVPKTDKIRFFKYVKIVSKPHEIDDSMLIKKQTIHLDDPSQNTIEVGVEVSSFTDKQLEANNTIKSIKSDYVTNEKMANVITPITTQISEIIQESDSIKLSVEELRNDFDNKTSETNASIQLLDNSITQEVTARELQGDRITSETSSLIEQLSTSFQLTFTQLQDGVDLNGEQLEQFNTYFRWDTNGAIIGKTGSPVEFFQTNEMIGFRENGVVIAQWERGTQTVDNLIARISIVIGTHLVEKYESPVVGISSIVRKVDL